jgi:hypothetical protein
MFLAKCVFRRRPDKSITHATLGSGHINKLSMAKSLFRRSPGKSITHAELGSGHINKLSMGKVYLKYV